MDDQTQSKNRADDNPPTALATRVRFWPYAASSLLGSLLLLPAFLVEVKFYDAQHHIRFAQNIAKTGSAEIPHVLFHLLTIAFEQLPGLDWNGGAVAAQMLLALLLIILATSYLLQKSDLRPWIAPLIVVASLILNPIALTYFGNHRIYFGYLYSNVYHNPTIWALKPFALAMVLLLAVLLSPKASRWSGPLAGLCAILACLGKPSLTIALLPALFLVVLIRPGISRRTALLRSLWVILPSLVCLGVQYALVFGGKHPVEGGIIWQPFAVLGLFSKQLGLKLLLSIAFPLAVLLLYPRTTWESVELRLSWATALFGIGYALLLNETGPRAFQGNFLWSAQIALFLLFFFSLSRFVGYADWRSPRWYVGLALLAGHLLSGAAFYVLELTNRQMQHW